MRIEELHLKNFRCFKELDITFPKDPKIDPNGSNLAVFIGLNGAGKSAILDAIFLLLTGYFGKNKNIYTLDDVLVSEKLIENKLTFFHGDEKIEWECNSNYQEKLFNEHLHEDHNLHTFHLASLEFSIFSYYKIDRNSITSSDSIEIQFSTLHKVKNSGFYDFEKWFEEEENIESELQRSKKDFNYFNPKLEFVRCSIINFLSNIANSNFTNLRVKRIIIEKNYSSQLYIDKNNKELKISQLSDGEKLLICLVGDIASHLANYINTTVYTNETFENNNSIENTLKLLKGIVLIDEIELHLHPQWQREVLPALQKTFPNIQFIVTTHSPQVLSNLKKEEIFILEDNKIVKVTPHVEGRDVSSILYELFGVEKRPKKYKDKVDQFYTLLEEKELDKAKIILDELTHYFGEQDSEIVRANLHLSFAEE